MGEAGGGFSKVVERGCRAEGHTGLLTSWKGCGSDEQHY